MFLLFSFRHQYGPCFEKLLSVITSDMHALSRDAGDLARTLPDNNLLRSRGSIGQAQFDGTIMRNTLAALRQLLVRAGERHLSR